MADTSLRPPRAAPTRLPGDQYRLLVEHSPTLTWRSGLDAKCDYFNETWLAFTGRTLEQEQGDGWVEGVHPDDLDRCVKYYLSHFERREPFEMEYRLRRHDGVYRWIFDRGVPFTDDSGAFAGFIGSCVDVDERRQAEQAKSTFLSLISHELRTPVTSMKAFLEGMRRRVEKGLPVAPEFIERLDAQTDRIARLVRELGDAGRLESGFELPVQLEPVDLREVVEHVVAQFQQVAESRSRSGVRYALEALLPVAPCPMRGDRYRLEQVVAQFVDNAFKYSPHGGTVRLELAPSADGYRLTVRDEGIGIPPADLASVTRSYFRAANASPVNFPGIGLGLSIAQQLTERHGGRIELASELGRGTTVTLNLPAAGGEGV